MLKQNKRLWGALIKQVSIIAVAIIITNVLFVANAQDGISSSLRDTIPTETLTDDNTHTSCHRCLYGVIVGSIISFWRGLTPQWQLI